MNEHTPDPSRRRAIEKQALAWVVRCGRGLTAVEQDDLSQWLAADAENRDQFARHRRHWNRLDHLAAWRPEHSVQPNPDLLAPSVPIRIGRCLRLALPFAALLAIGFLAWPIYFRNSSDAPPPSAQVARQTSRVLEDGSIVELNGDAKIAIRYSSSERQIQLERGEAYFSVAKDAARPFVVSVRGLDVRAVGTAFNVRLDTADVEVLVTHGIVQIKSLPESRSVQKSSDDPPAPTLLEARQRAVMPLAATDAPPRIATLTAAEIGRVLAWQHRLLDFTATPLSTIVAELNRRNPTELIVLDPELGSLPITASIRSDNIEGFLRLVEATFGVKVEHRSELKILLRKAD